MRTALQLPLMWRWLPEEPRARTALPRVMWISILLPEEESTSKSSPGDPPCTVTADPLEADSRRSAGASTRTR